MIGAIIGYGFVGQATAQLATSDHPFLIYDIDPKKCNPPNITLEEIRTAADVIFVCVPTPMDMSTGACCTAIVEDIIARLEDHKKIIIRSTVPIGFCERHGIAFMPEFLTEANAMNDFVSTPEWFIGIDHEYHIGLLNAMSIILKDAKKHKHIHSDILIPIKSKEAEMMKYFRNCFLATKVAFCNEIFRLCKILGIDYNSMILHATKDARIGSGHTRVPGPDGHFGFGGTCFPKDVSSLLYQMTSHGVSAPLLEHVQFRNNHVDRPEMDWSSDKGRAVV